MNLADFYIERGRLEPPFIAELNTEDPFKEPLAPGTPIRFVLRSMRDPVIGFTRTATLVDEVLWLVRYDWQAGDTDTVGKYYVRFIVDVDPSNLSRSRPFPFPDWWIVDIRERLGEL